MFRIERMEQLLGQGHEPAPKDFLQETFADRGEAVAFIKEYLDRFHQSDEKAEQGYWWGRNVGDDRNVVLRIC